VFFLFRCLAGGAFTAGTLADDVASGSDDLNSTGIAGEMAALLLPRVFGGGFG
jgi:hypothetical protein